jgi:hypothetical protein
VPKLPGVTITKADNGVAQGYLTAASAEAFGTVLAKQFDADHASGSYGTDGMFGDGVPVAGQDQEGVRGTWRDPGHLDRMTVAEEIEPHTMRGAGQVEAAQLCSGSKSRRLDPSTARAVRLVSVPEV